MKYKYNGQWVDVNIKALDGMTIGSIILFAGETIPTGWLICDGDTLNEEEYPELFDVIRYKYGGSGLDFNLPNFKGRVGVGLDSTQTEFDTLGETGGYKGLQKHTHQTIELGGNTMTSWSSSGSGGVFNLASLFQANQFNNNQVNTGDVNGAATVNGAPSTATDGNLQPYLVVNYIIKATNTTPTMASVVNAQSDSTIDAYSCDYENKHYNGVVLYEDNNGSTGNITLSDSITNYNEIEIEYSRSGYKKTTGKVKTTSYPLLDGYWYYFDSGLNKVIYQNFAEIPTISGTTITRNDTYYTNVVGDGGGTYTGNFPGGVAITRVKGYK